MKKMPNILFITSDQQHYNTLGCTNPEIKTPNLDKLAKQGIRFTRAYCTNPTCTPSRASLITGKYPGQHGAWALGTKLPETEPTLGQYLSQAGYRTTLIGKAHFQQLKDTPEYPSIESNPFMQDLDFWRKFHGPFYGFQRAELARNHTDEYHVGQHYAIWMEKKGLKDWRKYFRAPAGTVRHQQRWHWALPEKFHYDTWIAERTIKFLRQYHRKNQRFFLWASFLDPHPPYLVPSPWDTMYDPEKLTVPFGKPDEHRKNPPHFHLTQLENPDFSPWRESGMGLHGFHSHLHLLKTLKKDIAIYYGMISMMDKYIGLIIDELDKLGLSEDTIVIFTTDHGHLIGQHNLAAKGAFHYEDLLRVPFIVRWPGRVPENKISDALISFVDFAPTILSLCGLKIPRTMSGIDQSSVFCDKVESLRNWVLVENRHEPTTIFLKTYIEKRYKITVYFRKDYGELFDLENDPHEYNNLWNEPEYRERKNQLIKKLLFAEWEKEPLWMPRVWGA
ncbi:MAG TPA: sulfatase-like hydrolase/transferase [bacterium]|nr:sulfatase-like hydrolase/transferase [bacterium]